MRIAVLLKQVPASLQVSMKADYSLDRAACEALTNPADRRALDIALRWKKQCGAVVHCITMGPERATACLREAATAGADHLYLLSDARFAGADSYITARVLSAAIAHIGNIDIVLCGRHSVDGETGQVGPEVAAMLDWACVGNVWDLKDAQAVHCVACDAVLPSGIGSYCVQLPCVLCLSEGQCIAAPPSLSALRRAQRAQIVRLTAEDIGLGDLNAQNDSPTRVMCVHPLERKRRCAKVLDAAAAGNMISDLLQEIGRDRL